MYGLRFSNDSCHTQTIPTRLSSFYEHKRIRKITNVHIFFSFVLLLVKSLFPKAHINYPNILPPSSQGVVNFSLLVGEAVITHIFGAILSVARLRATLPQHISEFSRDITIFVRYLNIRENVAVLQGRDFPTDGFQIVLVAGFPTRVVVPVQSVLLVVNIRYNCLGMHSTEYLNFCNKRNTCYCNKINSRLVGQGYDLGPH
jgi:hypothetical protein